MSKKVSFKYKRKLGIIIQARMASKRLPGKILMNINGQPLILNLYKRINNYIKFPIVVATTTEKSDDLLVNLLSEAHIKIYRGLQDNVLDRYIKAAEFYGITDIIRICADNPFLDLSFLTQLINLWEKDTKSDYISFEYNHKPVILSHFGVFAEIVKLSALQKLAILFPENKTYQEHVTYGVYTNDKIFDVRLLDIEQEISPYEGIRLTIDTAEDFERLSKLIVEKRNLTFYELGNYILSQSELLEGMEETIRNNSK